jgi:uncharacterized membrane protein (DUF485 family)
MKKNFVTVILFVLYFSVFCLISYLSRVYDMSFLVQMAIIAPILILVSFIAKKIIIKQK